MAVFNSMKENEKESSQSKGRHGRAPATVCRPRSCSSPRNYFQRSGKPQIGSVPQFPHLGNKGPHTSSSLREFLWHWEAYVKCREHGCQTIFSWFEMPKSDGNKWNPKLNWYHMLWAPFSESLRNLAFIMLVGSSFSVYRNMCTHQNRTS